MKLNTRDVAEPKAAPIEYSYRNRMKSLQCAVKRLEVNCNAWVRASFKQVDSGRVAIRSTKSGGEVRR